MIVVACYAALDEVHQAFVPGRGASAWDSLLDTSGRGGGSGVARNVDLCPEEIKAPAGEMNPGGR